MGEDGQEPILDIETIDDITDGNNEMRRQMLELYLSQTEQTIEGLAEAIKVGGVDQIYKLAHKNAGSSATCGLRRLASLMRKIEMSGKKNKIDAAAAHFAEAEVVFDQTRSEIERLLRSDVNA